MNFDTLESVPLPIRDFYQLNDGAVELIPFGEEKTQEDLDRIMLKHQGKQNANNIVNMFKVKLTNRINRKFHDHYLRWLSREPVEPQPNPRAEIDPMAVYAQLMVQWQAREPELQAMPPQTVGGKPWGKYNHAKKRNRLTLNAEVDINGLVFHACEESQNRMDRAVAAMEAEGLTSTFWSLVGGSVQSVTIEQLKAARTAAGLYQTSIWFQQ